MESEPGFKAGLHPGRSEYTQTLIQSSFTQFRHVVFGQRVEISSQLKLCGESKQTHRTQD